jgi:hypothetical protein
MKQKVKKFLWEHGFWGLIALAGFLVIALSGCTKPPPPPPPPPPVSELLLRRDGSKFTTFSGKPFTRTFAWECCGYVGGKWPMAGRNFMREAAAAGFTGVGMRPFFLAGKEAKGPYEALEEDAWEFGPYAEIGGKANLNQFDQRFWDWVQDTQKLAEELDLVVEYDFDGWRLKDNRGGNPHGSPFHPEGNIQGEDIQTAARLTDRHKQFLTKFMETVGGYPNWIFQDGNEISLVPDYSGNYTLEMRNFIRQEEYRLKVPVHMFGSQGGPEGWPHADYANLHRPGVAVGPVAGLPTAVNEGNPWPPMTGKVWYRNWCKAQANGTYFDYWQHRMTEAERLVAWDLMKNGDCAAYQATCPFPDLPVEDGFVAVHLQRPPKPGRPWIAMATPKIRNYEWCTANSEKPAGECPVPLPESDPRRHACEKLILEGLDCPRWQAVCVDPDPDSCPITFDTDVGGEPWPTNAMCPWPPHKKNPIAFKTTGEGRGYISACTNGGKCSRKLYIDQ